MTKPADFGHGRPRADGPCAGMAVEIRRTA
jgi:hypothetical protein